MATNDWTELINPNTDVLRYIKKGVLYVRKEPFYVVELVKENQVAYVIVYKVHPGTEDNPKKAATEVVVTNGKYSTRSTLAQLASRYFPSKKTTKWIPKPPVFIAPVVPNQKDTFTGKYESGFFEREEDRFDVIGGEKKFIRGENTGVFIGLSSINWEDGYSIPTESLVKALVEYQTKDDFFDFTGNNQDKNNPLASYYEGGKL
jgi:hypothetical protein